MARIPYVETESASEDVRAVLEQMPANLNIFRMAAHAETNLRPLLTLGVSVLTNQKLDDRLRELAILRVARLTSAEYEWVQHVPIARLTGASDEEIAALERDDIEADCFDDKARAVLRFASEVNRSIGASQEAFDAAAAHLSHREIVELIIAVGFYTMMAMIMESTGIDLDEPMGDTVLAAARDRGEDFLD